MQNETQVDPVLKEASPRSINELFAADPLSLTKNDIESLVQHFRQERGEFLEKEQEKQMKKTSKKKTIDKKEAQDLLSGLLS